MLLKTKQRCNFRNSRMRLMELKESKYSERTITINVNVYIWLHIPTSYSYLFSTQSVFSLTTSPTKRENALEACLFSFILKLMNGVK